MAARALPATIVLDHSNRPLWGRPVSVLAFGGMDPPVGVPAGVKGIRAEMGAGPVGGDERRYMALSDYP